MYKTEIHVYAGWQYIYAPNFEYVCAAIPEYVGAAKPKYVCAIAKSK